jgi:hypothetical protein
MGQGLRRSRPPQRECRGPRGLLHVRDSGRTAPRATGVALPEQRLTWARRGWREAARLDRRRARASAVAPTGGCRRAVGWDAGGT